MMKKLFSLAMACTLIVGGLSFGIPAYAEDGDGSGSEGSGTKAETTVDKSSLEDLMQQAEALSTEGYSAESVAFFNAALASAKEMDDRDSATQQQVDKQSKLLTAASKALVEAEDSKTIYDGTYTIDGVLRHATENQDSMGNAGIVRPFQLVVDSTDSESPLTLKIELKRLKAGGFEGYLGEFWYYPGYEGDDVPYKKEATKATVDSSFKNVYDAYNDPKKGTDSRLKGKLYPHEISLPVELNDTELWTKVYVPAMEAISPGNGEQYARLQLDWSSLKQVSGVKTEKGTLGKRISDAETLLASLQKNSQGYTQKQIAVLEAGITAGKAVQDSDNMSQKVVDATARGLLCAINVFRDSDEEVDKSALKTAMNKADQYLAGDQSKYKESAWALLESAREYAQELYENVQATQDQVDTQTKFLNYAIANLKDSKKDTDGNNNNGNSGKQDNTDKDKESSSSTKLKMSSLKDGTYSVTGKMLKSDRKTTSMSDKAISHTIKITVKNGKYYVSMDFAAMKVNGQFGYLGNLKYFTNGYGTTKGGAPTGSVKGVTVDSYQKDSAGKVVKDTYGTNYPKKVTYPLIARAKKDGYIPLQVFVPIMEKISPGSGTQAVYLKLNYSTLKKASANDAAFSNHSGSAGSSSSLGSSSLSTSKGLKSSSLPGKSNGLKAGSGTAAGTTQGQGTTDGTQTDATGSSPADTADTWVPILMSILAAIGGVAYKLKSRGLLFAILFQ